MKILAQEDGELTQATKQVLKEAQAIMDAEKKLSVNERRIRNL